MAKNYKHVIPMGREAGGPRLWEDSYLIEKIKNFPEPFIFLSGIIICLLAIILPIIF